MSKNKVSIIFEKDRRVHLEMKKIIALSSLLALTAMGMACGDSAANNSAANTNKAVANAMNSAANAMNTAANQAAMAANQAATAANTAANTMKPANSAPMMNANANHNGK
ncbi:MAG: hypothetical protein ABI646_05755 [Acidobacteriota bacterium]